MTNETKNRIFGWMLMAPAIFFIIWLLGPVNVLILLGVLLIIALFLIGWVLAM